MPETTGAAATTSNTGTDFKGFLIGVFTAAAIGGAGLFTGVQYGDDIKAAFNTDSAVTTIDPVTAAPEIAPPPEVSQDITLAPTPAPVTAPVTQADLQQALITALDAVDRDGIQQAIERGANPHIILATAAKHVIENRGTGDTDYTQVRRMNNLIRAGVDPGETLATVAFNPYFEDTLQQIARLGPDSSNNANVALEITAANNDLEGFTRLMDADLMDRYAADITTNDFSVMDIAVENNSTYILQYALDWDTENNGGMYVYENGYDMIYSAVHNNQPLIVNMLVEANAHLMIPSYYMTSTFEQSAAGGHLSLYRAMIEDLGMDVTIEARLDDGTFMHSYAPTLIAAAENGYVEIGQAAIAAGAHPSSWKGTPAIRAAMAGHLDFIEMLRAGRRPADFRLQGGEAYIQAVQLGHDDIARFMISEQPELLDIRDGSGFNHAYRLGNLELFTEMLAAGGTAYKDAFNNIIDDNNLEFARAIFEHVASLDEGVLPQGTWNAITYRMSDDMRALMDQYPETIRPVLDPNAVYQYLSGPEL